MRFEGRELKSYAEPVRIEDLRPGEVYFSVQFEDGELLIPKVEPFVFLGRDLGKEGTDLLHFQSVESFRQGIRYDTADEEDWGVFQIATAESIKHIFEYERALDALMRCALKRLSYGGDRE